MIRVPSTPRRTLRCGVYGALIGVIAACGDSPTATLRTDGRILDLASVTYAEGRYVAVGTTFWASDGAIVPGSDTVAMAVSSDGRTWTYGAAPVAGRLLSVTHGHDQFVAVGNERVPFAPAGPESIVPVILTSPDGVTWSAAPVVPDLAFHSVAFGAGRFIAAGLNVESLFYEVAVSDDGDTWTAVVQTNILGATVGFGRDRFLLWGEAEAIGLSPDGEDWTVVGVDSVGIVRHVAFLGDRYVGMGDFDCCFGEVPGTQRFYDLMSNDAVDWTVRTQALGKVFFALAFGSERFVALTGREIVASEDAHTWSVVHESTSFLGAVAFGTPGFVSVGRAIRFSPDGLSWSRVE